MFIFSLQDAWSDSEGHVSLDSQQDYELMDAKPTPDGFYLLFRRPFSTCDPRDYLIEVRKVFFPLCVCVQVRGAECGSIGFRAGLWIYCKLFFGLVKSNLDALL